MTFEKGVDVGDNGTISGSDGKPRATDKKI